MDVLELGFGSIVLSEKQLSNTYLAFIFIAQRSLYKFILFVSVIYLPEMNSKEI